MSEQEHPVLVAVKRADGSVEKVRVGTAVMGPDGLVLRLGELMLGEASARAAPSSGGPVFPNYGRSKGAPVVGASLQDLEYYAAGCLRTLADPAKSRWHDKERALLATIEGEITRQGGAGKGEALADEPPPPGDADIPF